MLSLFFSIMEYSTASKLIINLWETLYQFLFNFIINFSTSHISRCMLSFLFFPFRFLIITISHTLYGWDFVWYRSIKYLFRR